MLALRHAATRKRPGRNKTSRYPWLEYATYMVAFVGPFLTLPQAYDVWLRHETSVNLVTWSSYLLFAIIWLIYGWVHKIKPIVCSNLLWLAVDVLVLLGVFFAR